MEYFEKQFKTPSKSKLKELEKEKSPHFDRHQFKKCTNHKI